MSSEVACSTAEQRPSNMETRSASTLGNKNKGMDHVIKTTLGTKKNNKENAKPANSQSMPGANRAAIKKDTMGPSAALQFKSDKNVEGSSGAGDAPRKTGAQAAQPTAKAPTAARGNGVKKRRTLSQAFLTQHAIRQRNLLAEAAKPPATVPPKYPPGTYKGRAIQSKVNSFRKPTGSDDGEAQPAAVETKPAAPEEERCNRRAATTGMRAGLAPAGARSHSSPGPGPAPAATAPRETSARARLQSAPCRLASRDGAGAPPARAIFSVPSKSTVAAKRTELQQTGKPRAVAVTTDRKAPKPPAVSTVSQYRIPMETAAERKAKLADWLASKGRTLRRPPIASAQAQTLSAPPKSSRKPQPVADPERVMETDPVAQQDSNPEPRPAEQPKSDPQPDARPGSDPEAAPGPADLSSPGIMNTTLDLLENSEMELPVDPEIRIEDVVVNLCNAMEALETPSACKKDPETHGDSEGRISEEEDPEDLVGDMHKEDGSENETKGIEKVKVDGETSVLKLMKVEEEEEEEECMGKMDGDEETPLEEASVVKYSIKTTPYLRSVTRRIHGDVAPGSGSRRRSAIKDLKFLTPVRRSVRIHRESPRLPGMLTDHDPCVSSLAELVRLDSDPNAYIYRRNPALLEELPDQPEGLGRV
ncbi:hypothetical protein AAFF_G00205370 [Aldrovandia affinis]|uniref:Cytoskeleton-associated protein 2 C-terminal domain-containing protein n=1 Tax=Aldrovandia affinis TaxID=143900 RepID=A0AAD7W6A5_9TELE|nr:hypothetical protein AAFF_G00205370 [Aldrovandia affinis]